MTIAVTHSFVSAITDDPAASAAGEVLPSHWNAAHAISGGTSGSVPFFDGSGNLAQDNANLFWDASNHILKIAGELDFSSDTRLLRESAGILSVQNGTDPQGFNIYNTWSLSGANYERAIFQWFGNVFYFGTQESGTGAARGYAWQYNNSTVLDFAVTAANTWTFSKNTQVIADIFQNIAGSNFQNTNIFGYSGFNMFDHSGNLSFSCAIGNASAGFSPSQAFIGTRQAWPMIFITNGTTERMRIDASGNVTINTGAIATNATDGFLYLETCAGAPTGVPTSYTGRVPVVIDTSTGTGKLWAYIGGTWRGVALT